jgi:RNA polymerase sigma-70 factor, ECF subfamily
MQGNELLAGLYRRYGGRVYARCLYFLKDPEEARDAVQEVFIKVHNNLDGFRQEASPLTWMTRIATNHCLNVIRAKKAPWHARYRQEVETFQKTHDGGFALTEHRELLRLCLLRVAETDADLAALATWAWVDELPQQEICKLASVSAPTLRKRLRQFVALCRDELKAQVPHLTFDEEAPAAAASPARLPAGAAT